MINKADSDLILIVDDSPETLGMLNAALEKENMTSLVALEGNQALSIASKMMPDIILLDAMMPNMDGFEVCTHLKNDPQLRSIPVIFMTGLSDTQSVIKGFESGGVDYITKPIVHSELIARIRVHLANTRLTTSVQNAMDLAGQYIFAVDKNGSLLWLTPQVNQLLEKYEGHDLWESKALPAQLKKWLNCSPSMGMEFTLSIDNESHKVIYLGKASDNEFLLRLLNNNTESEASIIQERLSLTPREAEVLLWITKGKTNKEIGQILEASPKTINKHSEKIYKKLEVDNRTSAASKAIQFLDH